MGHIAVQADIRLSCLNDVPTRSTLDQARLAADLAAEVPLAGRWLAGHDLADHDHLVVATELRTDRHIGLLAAQAMTSPREEFLFIEAAFVAPSARGRGLMQRMIALAMLQSACAGPVPRVVALCTGDPAVRAVLYGLARRFADAKLFPQDDSTPIDLSGAALARRIAREVAPSFRFGLTDGVLHGVGIAAPGPLDQVLTVLDLRGSGEAAITEDARRIWRGR